MDKAAFEGHAIWVTLDDLDQGLRASEGKAGPPSADYAARLRAILSYALSFKNSSHELFSPAMLDGAHSPFASAFSYMANWTASPQQADHLRQVVDYTEQALPSIGSWPTPSPRGGAARQAKDMYEAYQQAAESAIKTLKDEIADLQQRLAQTKADYDQRADEAESALEQLKAKIAEQETRIAHGEDQLAARVAESRDAFASEQEERAAKHDEWLANQAADLESRATPSLEELENQVAQAQQQVTQIEKLHRESENLAGKAAASILGGDYSSYSLREWIAGMVSYAVGFVILGLVAWFLLDSVSGLAVDAKVSWQYVALKLGITVTAAAAATVAFQLGSRLVNRSHSGKRAALELKAIGPFLADVDDEELVRKAKISFVERMFGRAWDVEPGSESKSNGENGSVASSADLLEAIRTLGRGSGQ